MISLMQKIIKHDIIYWQLIPRKTGIKDSKKSENNVN